MNDETESLLKQFIPEARDLLDQAGRSLLALEREPGSAAPLNALFRAVHTLKGTSGLFAIEPLTRLVHAGEDVLFAVQSGRIQLVAELTDALLDSLDQVGAWIDALAETSELPPGAEAISERGAERLRAMLHPRVAVELGGPETCPAIPAALPEWLQGLSCGKERSTPNHDAQLTAIRYSPDPHCFFRGEDPLALIRQLSGLCCLKLDPVEPWPDLAGIEPYACNIRLRAVTGAPRGEIEHLFRYVLDQVELAVLPAGWPDSTDIAADQAEARAGQAQVDQATLLAVLAAQRRLLEAAGAPEEAPARRRAAVRALHGVILQAGCADRATELNDAHAASDKEAKAQPLLAFIDAVLAAEPFRPATGKPDNPAAARAATTPDASAGLSGAVPAPGLTGTAPPATLRVEQAKIDSLMNLIGQLVVAKNAMAYLARRAEQGQLTPAELAREIKARHALVSRIADDMQGAVMSVRMLPVEQVFQRFPRLVRDVSRRLGKRVELIIEGGSTEVDKTIIEAIADPLIHMVRNSLDHGIEPPASRVAAGKPEHGTVRLTAAQDNDEVFIRVADDGRGIDPESVRRRAVEHGLLETERASALSDEEAVMLVFAPGFSTASEITDLSGRGVGMDAVRAAVEKIGGRISISSVKSHGTTVELALPLSMMVTRIMTVCCGERLFGIPMSVVVETVRVPRARIYRLGDREAFILRDSIVPVLRLAALLDLPDPIGEPEEAAILVVRINGERLGLVVCAFREGLDAIVKPLEGVLADARAFSGTTLLGDGRVLLVLDLRELVS